MKSSLRTLFEAAAVLASGILLGFALLLLAYLIPTGPIVRNAERSAPIFQEEGTYPKLFPPFRYASQLDDYTDALMLSTAAYQGEGTLMQKALLIFRYGYDGLDPCQSYVKFFSADPEDGDAPQLRTYGRYWHGYLIFLKPLLVFLDLGSIRILNGVIQTLLAASVVWSLWKKDLKRAVIPYLLAWGYLIPPVIGASLQFSDVYDLSTLGILIFLWAGDRMGTRGSLWTFLILGMATSYFDLLTYPIATLGMPLIACLLRKGRRTYREGLMDLIALSAAWAAGYIGMWAGKWVLASLLTDQDIIADASAAIGRRISARGVAGEPLSLFGLGCRLAYVLCFDPMTYIAGLYFCRSAFRAFKGGEVFRDQIIVLAVVAALPLMWYMTVRNHSFIHFWFVSKGMIVSVWACLCMFLPLADRNEQEDATEGSSPMSSSS